MDLTGEFTTPGAAGLSLGFRPRPVKVKAGSIWEARSLIRHDIRRGFVIGITVDCQLEVVQPSLECGFGVYVIKWIDGRSATKRL
jgi:hypothetical protein